MTVYVDNMYEYPIGQYGRMKMSHLIADSTEELLEMVDKIGVDRRRLQHPGTGQEHFDIALGKRKLAVEAGAVEITYKQCSLMCFCRKKTGVLCDPAGAVETFHALQSSVIIPQLCAECRKFYADLPNTLCPGCEAYRDHRR